MNTRLQQFIAAENISQAQLADSLNVARAGVSHILAGRNKPSYDFLTSLIQKFPRLNLEWLMFGKGKMYKDSVEVSAMAPTPKKVVESELLFTDMDLEEELSDTTLPKEIPSESIQERANINSLSNIINLDKQSQLSVIQRNVKKIIILFDDGTYQEM